MSFSGFLPPRPAPQTNTAQEEPRGLLFAAIKARFLAQDPDAPVNILIQAYKSNFALFQRVGTLILENGLKATQEDVINIVVDAAVKESSLNTSIILKR